MFWGFLLEGVKVFGHRGLPPYWHWVDTFPLKLQNGYVDEKIVSTDSGEYKKGSNSVLGKLFLRVAHLRSHRS